MFFIGEINKLKVLRKSDLGYMLSDNKNEGNEVLLHFKESKLEHENGDIVSVFLFYDKKHRLCATENEPIVTMSKPGFVTVVGVITGTGVFVSNNTSKDMLVSKDYLPYDFSLWPQIDDMFPVLLKEKNKTIFAKPLNKFEIADLTDHDVKYALNEVINAFVFRIADAGMSLVTKDFKHIFVHKTMFRGIYRIGQAVNVKIIHVKTNDEYNGSLVEQKENQIDPDKELLINYLKSHNGVMLLDSKSSSEDVEKILPLSRKAFKRALGGLYKDDFVYFEDGKTKLSKNPK